MNLNKLSALMWESFPEDNLVLMGLTVITEENLDELPVELIDEIRISRDEDYNIKIFCARNINRFDNRTPSKKNIEKEFLAGETIDPGKVVVRPYGNDYYIELSQCYYNGYISKISQTEYRLSCYHIMCKNTEKEEFLLKEWILNGGESGLRFYNNQNYKYIVEGSVSGTYGDFDFPIKDELPEKECSGGFAHFEFRDTAFDVHYVGKTYGPTWSENLSITYTEKYGRIPNAEERKMIRDFLSFITGTTMIYIGNSSYDENGNQIGFEMDYPRTYGFEIKNICRQAAEPPINDKVKSSQIYLGTVQNLIEPFMDLYEKLDLEALFTSYWYARNIAVPYGLPILSSALECLIRKWYDQVEANPDTLLMKKGDFRKRIKPVKELVEEQFIDTDFSERMKRKIDDMNRMSINEMIKYFFSKIEVPIGETEAKALQARNISAHGSFREKDNDYIEQYMMSKVYECLIIRTVLTLLRYEGKYIDYGSLGFPEKALKIPSGDKFEET